MTPTEAAVALRSLPRDTPGAFRLALELLVELVPGLPPLEPERSELLGLRQGGGSNPGPRPPWSPERRSRFDETIRRRRRG